MNLEKYTQKSQEALLAAQRLAQDYQQQSVEPIHLLLALIQQQDGIVRANHRQSVWRNAGYSR